MITSASNSKIKLVRTLQTHPRDRKAQGAFVAEGVRLVEEAIKTNWPIDLIIYDQTLSERGNTLIETLSSQAGLGVFEVTPEIMAGVSDTETPQGILAVVKSTSLPLPAAPTFVILADQIRDPGNMGTLLRTAEAAGAEAVLLSPGTVDPYSPKVVRAGAGAHFYLSIHPKPWQEIHAYLKGLPIFLADSADGMPLWEADFSQPCALMIGGEAFGASSMGEQLATHRVTIPMPGRVESLNAAVAAGMLMAEVMRQRYQLQKET